MKRAFFKILAIVLLAVVCSAGFIIVKQVVIPYINGYASGFIPDPIKTFPNDALFIDYNEMYHDSKSGFIATYRNASEESFNKYIDICIKQYWYKVTSRSKDRCTLEKGDMTLSLDLKNGNKLHIFFIT